MELITNFWLAVNARTRLFIFMLKNLFRGTGITSRRVGFLFLGLVSTSTVYHMLAMQEREHLRLHIADLSRRFYDAIYTEKDGFFIAGHCNHGHDSKCMMIRESHHFNDEVS